MLVLDQLTSISLREAVDGFLTDLQLESRSPKTLRFYRQNLIHLVELFPDKNVGDVTADDIRACFQSRDLSKTQALHAHHRSFRAFFNWCRKQNYVRENPVAYLSAPKVPRKVIATFTPDEIKRMLATQPTDTFLGRRNRLIVLMLFDTGMRLSELVGLALQDIDLSHGALRVQGKGNKERIVGVGPMVVKALKQYLGLTTGPRDKATHRGPHDALFLSEERRPLTDTGVQQAVRDMGTVAGIRGKRLSPHTFRHTFAVNFLRAGGNLRDLQTIGGWESLQMVMRYTQDLKAEDALAAHRRFSPADRLL